MILNHWPFYLHQHRLSPDSFWSFSHSRKLYGTHQTSKSNCLVLGGILPKIRRGWLLGDHCRKQTDDALPRRQGGRDKSGKVQ